MKIAGIIAEYNPFHNGHAYQVEQVKKRTGADYVVAAISGDFVQRGAPALMDKYARTAMALSCGVDLVIELPALWAAASAEHFAAAGVALFDQMGCMDFLCFGAETDNLPLLISIAEILAKEPASYRNALRIQLKDGKSFPLARELALLEYMAACRDSRHSSLSLKELHCVLSSPNNILAVEYLKALRRRDSAIKPVLIKREGAGHHDDSVQNPADLAPNAAERNVYASASAIRSQLLTDEQMEWTDAVPASSRDAILSYQTTAPFLSADDFSSILGYRLFCEDINGLSAVADCKEEIANRLYRARFSADSFTQFCERMKSRDLTYSRMSRILLHLILGHTKDDYALGISMDYTPYVRILGIRRRTAASFHGQTPCASGRPLLSVLKKATSIPLISKLSKADTLLPGDALLLLEKDIFAANLYEQVKFQKSRTGMKLRTGRPLQKAGNEYTQKIVLL